MGASPMTIATCFTFVAAVLSLTLVPGRTAVASEDRCPEETPWGWVEARPLTDCE